MLSVFAVYSALPFFWSMLQSVKTVRQANSPTPLIFFTPTFQNYAELWLDAVPQNLTSLLLALIGVIAARHPCAAAAHPPRRDLVGAGWCFFGPLVGNSARREHH